MDRGAWVAPLLAPDQRTCCPQTGPGSVGRHWPIKNEIRTHGKGAADTGLPVNNANLKRILVEGRSARLTQDLAGQFRLWTIHNNDIVKLAGDFAGCPRDVRAFFDRQSHLSQDLAKDTAGIRIRRDQKRTSRHAAAIVGASLLTNKLPE
jgi:hypothetical protein